MGRIPLHLLKESGVRSYKHIFSVFFQFILGVCIIAGAWVLIERYFLAEEKRHMPQGFTTICPPREVCCMILAGGTLWTGGKDGLALIDTGTAREIPPPPGKPPLGYVRALWKDRKDTIWIAHDLGLERYAGGEWHSCLDAIDRPVRKTLSLRESARGTLWVGTEGGIIEFENDRGRFIPPGKGICLESADALYEDRRGILWIGCSSPTRGALYRYDRSSWREYTSKDGLPHSSVNMITEDRQGSLWIATGFSSRGGAARLSDGVFTSLLKKDGLAGDKVRSVYEDSAGRLWFGAEYDGVAILDRGAWRIIAPDRGLAGKEVKTVLEDTYGVYWIGTDGGLTRIDRFESILKMRGRAHGLQ